MKSIRWRLSGMHDMNINERLLRLRPPRIAMSLVLGAVAVHFLGSLQVHPALPIAGLAIGSAGFLVMIRAWWLFRVADTAICPTAATSSLVTDDVFSVSRNPMYLGMILMLAAIALAIGSAPFYVALAAFGVTIDRAFCPFEEQKLRVEFGDTYAAYVKRVRRWL